MRSTFAHADASTTTDAAISGFRNLFIECASHSPEGEQLMSDSLEELGVPRNRVVKPVTPQQFVFHFQQPSEGFRRPWKKGAAHLPRCPFSPHLRETARIRIRWDAPASSTMERVIRAAETHARPEPRRDAR